MNDPRDIFSPQHIEGIRAAMMRGYPWDDRVTQARRPLENLSSVLDIAELIREAKRVQENGHIILAMLSADYLDVGTNWIYALRKLGITSIVVLSGDDESHQAMQKLNIASVRAHVDIAGTQRTVVGYSLKGLAIMSLKYPTVRELLRAGISVISSDIDAIWLRDPRPFFTTDLAFQRVYAFPQVIARVWTFTACGGFIYFRSTSGVIDFMDRAVQENSLIHDDQVAFNLALVAEGTRWSRADGTPMPLRELSGEPELRTVFAENSRETFTGRTERSGLSVTALPHHQFLRHPWVSHTRDELVVYHPPSIKDGSDKMNVFRSAGMIFAP